MRSLIWTSVCSIGFWLPGCSGGNSIETVPAGGVVTYNGQPVTGAAVSFVPEMDASGKPPSVPLATATTDEQGHFKLASAGEVGAVVGKYKVTVTKYESSGAPAVTPVDPSTSDPQQAMKQMMQSSQSRMAPEPVQPGGRAPMREPTTPSSQVKSLIPVKYADPLTTPLQEEVTAAGPNDFKLELTDG